MPKVLDDDVVMTLVEETQTQPLDAREAYLRAACGSDSELFEQVWDHVLWNHRMRDFLQEPLLPPLRERRLQPGELLLGRFRIIGELGEGGMGIVYAAEDERLGRRIALKCAKSGFRKLLAPETLNASEIAHPNVCKIFEIHTTPTSHGEIDFLTMEFLKGETLGARLGRGPLPEAEARAIARQICAGLAEAHRNGVVHGDLKSNNVILTRDAGGGARAVITDFGLARRPLGPAEHMADRTAGSSRTGGTPDYMAPELWKGEKPSAVSDVYALGVMLYELAASRRPFAGEIPWQERSKHKPGTVRGRWDPIVQRCLNPDPARRFRDAGDVAAALEPSRALRWWLAAAAAVVLAAVSGLVTYEWYTGPPESVRLALLPLQAGPEAATLARTVSLDAVTDLARLKGNKRVRLNVIPLADVMQRHVDSVVKARDVLRATHVVSGTVAREDGRVVLHVYLTDTRNQTNSRDWKAEYAPGEVLRYAPPAMTGVVTSTLRLPPLAMAPVNAKARQDYTAGLEYTRRNSTIDKALPLLERAVAADPDSPLTWAGLAEAQWFKYFATKDPAWLDRTSESLRQAQDRDLDLAPVHRVAGVLLHNAGFYQRAEEEYLRAIELEPLNGENYRRLGQAYDGDNRVEQSLEAFRRATELDATSARAWNGLGTFYRNHGNYSEEVKQFEKCVRLEPREADSHFTLGTAYLDLRRYPEAERELRFALALNETPGARNNLALLLTDEGRDGEAIPEYVRALKLSPGQYLSWMNLGSAYRRTNRKEESRKAYLHSKELAEEEIPRNPHDGTLRARLAYLCARLGDGKRAESELEQALHDSPQDTLVLSKAVLVHEALGDRQSALAILKNLPREVLLEISRDPDLADLHKESRFKELIDLHNLR
jgi:eukaryotic-like serine/threonine-protein kinase